MKDDSSKIIFDTYKVIGEIGSGGAGIVYLAEHLRLNKKVVLKSDKRSFSNNIVALRREVDSLKNLSHTYIPQVYDFFEQDGEVFTVMDYILGESFDKPLKRGEKFSQAKIVEWACQLLEALSYLHSRQPNGILHADIKPANVMLTPSGDVRLIDFNIALALGEEGAISVGRSFGYASPEHYGMDYPIYNDDKSSDILTNLDGNISYINTIVELNSEKNSNSNSSNNKRIMLDRRSDIYSLGATLYHIITGRKPSPKAIEVQPISADECNEAISVIISKAMEPNPDLRYQTADEMLYDFNNLRTKDSRSTLYKKNKKIILSLLCFVFILGGITTFYGLTQIEKKQKYVVLSEYSKNALEVGDVNRALSYALEAIPQKNNLVKFNTSQAQLALTNALGVYDLSDGYKPFKTIELPSAPILTTISPDGKFGASLCGQSIVLYEIGSGNIVETLPAEKSALSEIEFLDNNRVVYAGKEGITAYDLVKKEVLWKGKNTTAISVSGDKKTIAGIYKAKDEAIIYDSLNGNIIKEISFKGKHQSIAVNDIFANPKDNIFSLNYNGTFLGISFGDGSLGLYNLKNDEDIEIFDSSSGFSHFEGGFFKDYFGFSATNSKQSVFAVIDVINLEQTGGFESEKPFAVKTSNDGIFVKTENILVKIDPVSGEQTPLVSTNENISDFSLSNNHTLINYETGYSFFNKDAQLISNHNKNNQYDDIYISEDLAIISSSNSPDLTILKYENNTENEISNFDINGDYDEARFSEMYSTVIFFSYDKFCLFDLEGNLIKKVEIPNNSQVHDQQFIRKDNEEHLEVYFNDGTIMSYSAKNGEIIEKIQKEKPDKSLDEEFFTSEVRIEAPLHGTPIAYDRKSNKVIKELEKDAYLTYVTEIDEYIITEYVTVAGDRYGVLLNNRCETLAYLPNLCDIIDDNLIFIYEGRSLRKTHIYKMEQLVDLAKNNLLTRGGK